MTAKPAANKQAAAPDLVPVKYLFSDDHGWEVPFLVYVSEPHIVKSLLRGTEDAQVSDFFKAVRASDNLVQCFKKDGGMKLPAPFQTTLRVVPVFTHASVPKKDLIYFSEKGLVGQVEQEVVIYLDMMRMLAGRPENTMRMAELKTTWLTMKIVETVALAYAEQITTAVGDGPKASLAKALVGMMLVGSFDCDQVTGVNRLKRKEISSSSGAPPAKRAAVARGGASSSSGNM